MKITAANNRTFKVVIIKNNESYGLNGVLTHDREDPLVEFYDCTDSEQFVTRYFLSTLLEGEKNTGLNLHGGVAEWSLDAKSMNHVRSFLKKTMLTLDDEPGVTKHSQYDKGL